MRAVLSIAVLLAGAALDAAAATPAAPARAGGDAMQSLRERLLALTDEQLRPAGLSVDRARVWLNLSGPLSPGSEIAVRPLWAADGQVPQLPLVFELHAVAASGATGQPVRATLAAPLMREVAVTARRIARGTAVGCTDVTVERRALQLLPPALMPLPCALAAGAVALHDLAPGAALRRADVGSAPAVMAGSAVSVKAQVGGISVVADATALRDAQVGERVDVRLQRAARTVKAQVTGPNAVLLLEGTL